VLPFNLAQHMLAAGGQEPVHVKRPFGNQLSAQILGTERLYARRCVASCRRRDEPPFVVFHVPSYGVLSYAAAIFTTRAASVPAWLALMLTIGLPVKALVSPAARS